MKCVFVFLPAFLAVCTPSSAAEPAGHVRAPYEVHAGGKVCVLAPWAEDLKPLVPCAWEQVRSEMYRRFPSLEAQHAEPSKPHIAYRRGQWYSKREETLVSGETDPAGIKIAITDDLDDSFDTMIHEFKHWWVRHLIQKSAQFISTLWVDLVDSPWKTECKGPATP